MFIGYVQLEDRRGTEEKKKKNALTSGEIEILLKTHILYFASLVW